MASSSAVPILILFTTTLTLLHLSPANSSSSDPTPTPWPEQFHSILLMNYTGKLEVIDLWYDWPNGRNFNIIQKQLGKLKYDLEWNNGTSFFYTLDSDKECSTAKLEVGILRPNWLDGAEYLGQRSVDGFLCNVWQKVDFIVYYEDVVTKRPVHWRFYTGREAHVMTFEVGAVLEDAKWQAPVYCFEKKNMKKIGKKMRSMKKIGKKMSMKKVGDGDEHDSSAPNLVEMGVIKEAFYHSNGNGVM